MYARYDANDVAKYVLSFCENVLRKPITNLQLQEILYYIQGEYLSRYRKPLFKNVIQAWDYGPVVPDVYYRYNRFISSQITGVKQVQDNLFKDEEIELINQVVQEKVKSNVWDLVGVTHKEDPWSKNYVKGYKNVISKRDMEKWFIENMVIA